MQYGTGDQQCTVQNWESSTPEQTIFLRQQNIVSPNLSKRVVQFSINNVSMNND